MAKKTAKKTTLKAKPPAKPASKPAPTAKRMKWFDDKSGALLIDDYARQLGTFIQALTDGHVDDSEVKQQEERLVKLMKEVEPKLDDVLHPKVTRLLCELTAYDLMQVLNSMHKARPKTAFRG